MFSYQVLIEVLIALNVVESAEDGVISNLTFPPEMSLLNDARVSLVLTIANSVLYVVVPSCTMIKSTV